MAQGVVLYMRSFCLAILSIYLIFCCPNLVMGQDKKDSNNKKIVYVISLKGEILQGLTQKIQQKFKRIDQTKAKAVILEIDTPGGIVFYVLKICKEIDKLINANIPVYAYVTGYAWSGGALVSLACDKIFMVEQASIGSAQVKIPTPFGMKDADEKSLSAMRAHFRAYAEHHNYPKRLAEAMVDPSIEVKKVFYRRQRFFKTQKEINEMRELHANDNEPIIEEGIIVKKGELANFTAKEAKEYGLCKAIYQNRNALIKEINLEKYDIKYINTNVQDQFINLLSSGWLKILLIALGILGILIEFWTPGFGIPGILGIACIAFVFVGGYLGETAASWEILLFFTGIVLIAVEIFVIPGFGVTGILGIIICFVGLLLSLQTFVVPSNETEINLFMINIFNITFSIGIDILLFVIIARFLPENAPLRRLSVATVQDADKGYSVAIPELFDLKGKQGIAATNLRPSGRVEIEEQSYDVVTQGDLIEMGEKIQVIEVQGNRVIVDRIQES